MKFKEYLSEAPIRIDLSNLRHRLDKAFNNYNLIDGLNKEFKRDDITFSSSNLHGEDDVVNAFTFPETLEIEVVIGVQLLGLTDKELMDRLVETLEHEMVHREQLKRSDGKAHSVSMETIDADNVDQYLSDKQEIMAYAIQIVTTLRNENYTDIQIIDMIRRPKNWANKIVKSRSHLEMYLDVFKKDSYQVKRLKKQMIQYIGE